MINVEQTGNMSYISNAFNGDYNEKKNQHLICQKEMKDLRHVLYITSCIKASATLRSTINDHDRFMKKQCTSRYHVINNNLFTMN